MFIVTGLLGKGRFRDPGIQLGQIVTDFLYQVCCVSILFLKYVDYSLKGRDTYLLFFHIVYSIDVF